MKKVNTNQMEEESWESPKGKFRGFSKGVSIALGRDPRSTDLLKRYPFDVEILRVPAGGVPYPFHSHSAQWEFYHVIEGNGKVRHDGGEDEIGPGDAFIFKPGENHQLINPGSEDMVVYVIADNPVSESFYYPDSGKWGAPIPSPRYLKGDAKDYYDGEE